MRATATWRGRFRSDLTDGRGHAVGVDWPPEDGGEDTGPGALELCVMSLAGCVSTIFSAVATKRKVPYEGLEVDVRAERPRGAPTIATVHGRVTIRSAAPRKAIETALRITLEQCPVGVLFDRAGVASTWDLDVVTG